MSGSHWRESLQSCLNPLLSKSKEALEIAMELAVEKGGQIVDKSHDFFRSISSPLKTNGNIVVTIQSVDYQIKEEISGTHSGFSTVYRAIVLHDPSHQVAIKWSSSGNENGALKHLKSSSGKSSGNHVVIKKLQPCCSHE